MDISVELRHAPVEGGRVLVVVPIAVEPNAANASILREQFMDLCLHEVEVAVIVRLAFAPGVQAGAPHRIIGAYPVKYRVVEMQTHTLFATGLEDFEAAACRTDSGFDFFTEFVVCSSERHLYDGAGLFVYAGEKVYIPQN